MRRPAFSVFLISIMLIVLLDYFSVPLNPFGEGKTAVSGLVKTDTEMFYGRIVGIKATEEKVKFEVEIDDVKVLLTLYEELKASDYENLFCKTISFKTKLDYADEARNPNCFNYRRYLKSEDIELIGTIEGFEVIGEDLNPIEKYKNFLFKTKTRFKEELLDNSKGIVMGTLFGDTTSLDEDIYDEFRANGTAHVLAVSGLHVGLIYSMLRKFPGNNGKLKTFVILFFLLSFGFLSMWSTSAVRAEAMIALKIIAEKLDLRYDMLNSLGVVGLGLILFNPYVIYGASFQMSFLAIVSIGIIMPKLRGKVPEIILLSISVYIGLLIYQIFNYNYISLTSVIANIPIVYFVSLILPVFALSLLLFIITQQNAAFTKTMELLSKILIKLNELSTLGGKGSVMIPSFSLFVTIIIIISTVFIGSEIYILLRNKKNNKLLKRSFAVIIISSVLFQTIFYSPVTYDDIIFVDVGQGDCCHINDGKTDILIDGGGKYNYNVGEKVLSSYLLKNGNSDIDLALATHEHMDHYKGLCELCEVYDVKKLESGKIKGDTIYIDEDLYIETLWPLEIKDETSQDENSQCSVFMVYYNGYKILITGDLDKEGEAKLLSMYDSDYLKADILKVGHHGSSTSTSLEFIEAVNPTYAVISVGKNNYGHPSSEVIENLKNSGIMVYSTLESGAVGFRLKKNEIQCHTMIKQE